ncbi:hypothetical protein ABPG72_012161 [Tetrahymena utriculariae]
MQQQFITQSDRIFIIKEQQVWLSTQINPNQFNDFNIDLSQGKFQKIPKVVYGFTVYNSDTSSQQGFLLSTNSINQTSLSYRLQSQGCTLTQLGFNILAFDDPNIEIQSIELRSGITTIINGTQNIQQIAGFIYGFQGNSGKNLVLKYSLTQIDNMHYQIQFNNINIQIVYINFLIIYQNYSPDIFQQLYAYQTFFDTQGQGLADSDTKPWISTTYIDQSQIFFGLKDFNIASGGYPLCQNYFGIKILSGQNPEAQNKQILLNYFSWNSYYVNMINGIWIGLSLFKCQTNYTLFINSTYYSCVKSCNTIDHHYNTNPQNNHTLYSTNLTYCQQCDPNCYGCQDGYPSTCTDCYNNQYLNPYTNSCDQTPPPNTFCQFTTINGQNFYNCQQCDSTCQQCSAAADPNSCISCDISSLNKYLFNNQCLASQPDSTFCNSNYVCQQCDQTCDQCKAPSDANQCTSCNINSLNKYFYNNQCLSQQPSGTYCDSNYVCYLCDSNCRTCVNTAKQCTSCEDGLYLYDENCFTSQPKSTYCQDQQSYFDCKDCFINCQSCNGLQQTNCISCISNYYFQNNTCFEMQPNNTYCDLQSLICKQCSNNNCQICDSSLSYCLSCPQKYYLYKGDCYQLIPKSSGIYCDEQNICFDCSQNCFNCSKDLNKCTECSANQYLYNYQCNQTQPQGTSCILKNNSNQYPFSDCTLCQANNCNSCNQEKNKCDSCIQGANFDSNQLSCQCPEGYYVQTNQASHFTICSECLQDNCSQCNQFNCIQCRNGYFLNSQGQCTYCQNGMYADIANNCNQPCQNGCKQCTSFQNCFLFDPCDTSCQTCKGPSAKDCLSCSSATRIYDPVNHTCDCQEYFESDGTSQCQYIYQIQQQLVSIQYVLNLSQLSLMIACTIANFIPGMQYSINLMQLIGNFYFTKNKSFYSATSIFSSYTIYNIFSLIEQQVQSSNNQQTENQNTRLLQQVQGSLYPTYQQNLVIIERLLRDLPLFPQKVISFIINLFHKISNSTKSLFESNIQQQLVTQSDRIVIKQEQQVWSSSSISSNSYKDFSVDLSSVKFQSNPIIMYALTIYNSDTSIQQGFKITTNSVSQMTLSYRLTSLGCTLDQLGFNILAIDDPNIEVQAKQLSSGVATTITGTQNIQQIAGFIYGFQGSSSSNMCLKYSLTKIDNMNYQISFSNSNVQTIYVNFIIVYQNSSTDMFQQLYSYQTLADTQGQYIGGSNTVTWASSTQIDSSLIFFGLKDFDISSGGCFLCSTYFGIKLLSGQNPEAQNTSVKLNYLAWNNYNVNMVNAIWMGFSLTKCQTNYYLFIYATYFSCAQSCNTVDHHYNTNPSNTYNLYSTSIAYCQQCNTNCYGCQDGNPSVCTDCYNNQYLNPSTNTCDSIQPPNTFCQLKTVSGQSFYNCQKCDSTCQSCSAASNPKSCTSCNINSQNKYLYNNQCFSSNPNSTYCDSNFICQSCDLSCKECVAPGNANSCTQCDISSSNMYFYNNSCQNSQPVGTFCDSNFICQKCSPNCQTCLSSINYCSSCLAGQYLYKDQCFSQQPQSTYCQQYVCYDCPTNCYSCSGGLSTNCTSCISNFYFYNNQCFSQQPPSTYCDQNNFQCQKCQTSCQKCDVTLNICTSCSSQYLYKGVCYSQIPKSYGIYCDQTSLICVDCDQSCFNCLKNINQCTECQLGYYFYNNQCFQYQPQNTSCSSLQKNSNQNQFLVCQICQANNCNTCNMIITQCDTCIIGSVFNKQNLSCDCPNGYYLLTNFPSTQQICNKCNIENCTQCNQSGCTKCESGYFLNQNGKCVHCQNSMYADQNNQCSQPCKKGCLVCSSLQSCAQQYDNSCDLSCKNCTGPSANECLTCSSAARQLDLNDNTCKCLPNFSETGNRDCQYNYQLSEKSVEIQSALNIVQAATMIITSVSQVIPGMSYSLGLMQMLGNVYLNQNNFFNSTTSIFSSFTIFNINSYLEQKIQASTAYQSHNNQRRLQSVGSIYPIQYQSNLIVQDKFYFATNNFIQICIIMFIFLIALAFHLYQIRAKEELKYLNIVRWNMLLFLIQISSNFFLITLIQCNISQQRMIDLVFIAIFLVMYALFFIFILGKIYKNEQLEPQVLILSHGIDQESVYSKYFFVIFEIRKIIYTVLIVNSKQSLTYTIWLICAFQLVFILLNFKTKVLFDKFSYIFLQINEIFFLVLFSILAMMITVNKQRIIQILGNILISLMMLLSVTIVIQVLFFVAFKLRDIYLRQRTEIQNKNDRLSISKIELLRCSISLDQKIMWRHRSTMKSNLAIKLAKNA